MSERRTPVNVPYNLESSVRPHCIGYTHDAQTKGYFRKGPGYLSPTTFFIDTDLPGRPEVPTYPEDPTYKYDVYYVPNRSEKTNHNLGRCIGMIASTNKRFIEWISEPSSAVSYTHLTLPTILLV